MRCVRFGLVPLLLIVFASQVLAQTTPTDKPASPEAAKHAAMTTKSPEEMAKTALAKWKETLKLTPEQEPQFESVMMDSYKKMADAKTAAAGDKAKMKASMQTIFKEREEALAKVLTPEQMKTYRAKLAEGSHKMKAHMAKTGTATSK